MIAGLAPKTGSTDQTWIMSNGCLIVFANVASLAFFGDCASLAEYKDVTL
jgi:hypothetical protein